MDQKKILDKAQGALIGFALGDTIGLYTEFLKPEICRQAYPTETFSLVEPVTEPYQDTHRSKFERRAWTDDTDHTILMILSYLRNGVLSPDDFALRLRTWCEQGLRCLDRLPLGLGQTVGRVVFDSEFKSNPTDVAFKYWEKTGHYAAANGSLMGTSPIGVICMNKTEEETIQEAIRMGAVTHADPRCAVSVALVSALVRALCRDEIKDEEDIDIVLERVWIFVTSNAVPEFPLDKDEFQRHVYAETLESLVLWDGGIGYVYKCLGSGIWCLRQVLTRQETFKSAMTKLIMSGGDADTNGAVAGALMGALYGWKYLPKEWRNGMKHEAWYSGKISELCVRAGLIPGTYDAAGDRDTEADGGNVFLSEDEMQQREMQLMEKLLKADKQKRDAAGVKVRSKVAKGWKFW